MICNLAHLCFTVRDLEASIVFYRDVLGLAPAFDFRNDDGKRFGAYLHVGGRNFIELFQAGADAGNPGELPSARDQHCCLEVDDLQATVDELRAKGLQVSDPKLGADESWQAWLADPDGNRFELHQYTPASQQTPWVG